MSAPSFMYSAVNPSVEVLTEALDHMGGGDARVARMEVHCLVNQTPPSTPQQQQHQQRQQSSEGQVLWIGQNAIGVRNIDMPKSAAIADGMSYHEVTTCNALAKKDFAFVDTMPHRCVKNQNQTKILFVHANKTCVTMNFVGI